ncbi:MAG TPA: hypothetical protein VKL22_05190 [Actinomycetota bacterium]|nr:hypothetical protein [Actinomycetota bacterium]
MGAAASLNPTTMPVEPGSEAISEIRVRNTGKVVDQFLLGVVGDPAAWASVEPPSLSLLPGDEGVATVRFRPPRSSDVRAGSFPFGVKVVSKEDPEGSVTEEGTLEVAPFRDLGAELIPRTARGRTDARYELAVDNRGNQTLNADLAAVDPNDNLRFRFSPPALGADPNTAVFSKLTVRPAKRFLRGVPKTHTFQAVVKPRSTPPVTVDGVMLQEPILPAWLPKAALALVALALLAGVLWLTLLKPAIKSSAKEAVAAPLATQSAQVAALAAGQKQVRDAVTKLTGSPLPTPSVSLPALVTGPGDPVHSRLPAGSVTYAPGSDKSDSGYTVPANMTLSVADILLENPQGDSGTVLVQQDGSTLLVENLDNFRDLDYHFVSPPVLTAGQHLILRVQCAAGNQTQGGQPAKLCNPSVFFTGFLKPA